MASQQFMDLYQKINVANQVGIEDSVDRLNLFTVVLFALAAVMVGVKQYIMNDISCYIPVSPTGDKFKEFVNDYCWVHGTIPLRLDEAMPNNDEVWNEYDKFRRIMRIDGRTILLTPLFNSRLDRNDRGINTGHIWERSLEGRMTLLARPHMIVNIILPSNDPSHMSPVFIPRSFRSKRLLNSGVSNMVRPSILTTVLQLYTVHVWLMISNI
ncbi:uncharacterized protein DEA37_0011627 [Paragonimus westermani]|uniref:Innexin n=1 Tax=Paragonimus westermani TaxID=34504 RepID=A0A5J4NSX7_9TREM|nr:uncharacterized protein DEA37_0011627 [Paragonimus westermani]